VLEHAGVYLITCLPTGKQYVGSTTVSFRRRFAQHRHTLRRGDKYNPKLINAWKKYGECAFEFRPLLACRPEDALQYEQLVIDAFQPELNVCTVAGNCIGVRHSSATREKAVARARRQWASGVHSKDRLRQRAKNRARRHTVHGEELTIEEMVARYGLKKVTIASRLKRGVSGDALVAPPQEEYRVHLVQGEKLTSGEIAAKYNIGVMTVLWRVRQGWVGDDLIKQVRGRK
jgi:group I intron endonuclease